MNSANQESIKDAPYHVAFGRTVPAGLFPGAKGCFEDDLSDVEDETDDIDQTMKPVPAPRIVHTEINEPLPPDERQSSTVKLLCDFLSTLYLLDLFVCRFYNHFTVISLIVNSRLINCSFMSL